MGRRMKRLLAVICAIAINSSPCKADDEDVMLAIDALTTLGFSTVCLHRLQNRPMDTGEFFKSTLNVLNQKFRRVYGVTLTAISTDLMHNRPENYILSADSVISGIKSQDNFKSTCLNSANKLKSVLTTLSLKGKH